jgi:hypothetical protein
MRICTRIIHRSAQDKPWFGIFGDERSGGIEWQARYAPFGETRWTSGALTTNRKPALSAANGFNGMKEESALGGIYDFNARYGVYPERSEGTPRSGGS